MKFQLKEAKRNKINVTFHVLDQGANVVGSVNVKVEDAADLRKHWVGGSSSHPQPPNLSARALAKEFLKHRRPVSQANILRGCNG
jgi:hypothetical protein